MSNYWYPFYPSKFKSDTRHLTAEQDGIYRRLLDEYMETREPLPDNDIALSRIAGVSEVCWAEAKLILIPYFEQKDGLLYHDFCNNQLDIQDKKAKKRSQSAEKAAKKRWSKSKHKQTVTCVAHTNGNTDAMRLDATDTDTDTDTVKEDSKPDLHQAVSLYNEMAEKYDLSKVAKLTNARKPKLAARLKDCGGINGWVIALEKVSSNSFLLGENDRGWKADFDFIIAESKFTKIMEDGYKQNPVKRKETRNDVIDRHARELEKEGSGDFTIFDTAIENLPKLQ